METNFKKTAVKKAQGRTAAQMREGLKQPGIIFAGFKTKLSSAELLERLNEGGK